MWIYIWFLIVQKLYVLGIIIITDNFIIIQFYYKYNNLLDIIKLNTIQKIYVIVMIILVIVIKKVYLR